MIFLQGTSTFRFSRWVNKLSFLCRPFTLRQFFIAYHFIAYSVENINYKIP